MGTSYAAMIEGITVTAKKIAMMDGQNVPFHERPPGAPPVIPPSAPRGDGEADQRHSPGCTADRGAGYAALI